MDSFKIVAVMKKRGAGTAVEYCFVPHKWEQNNLLFWPKANLKRLREDASSKPQEDWLQYKCKVKKTNVFGLEEAELWEEEFVNATTDAEENLIINKNTKLPQHQPTNNDVRITSQFDELFHNIDNNTTNVVPPRVVPPSEESHSTAIDDDETHKEDTQTQINQLIENQKYLIKQQDEIVQTLRSEFLQLKLTVDAIHKTVKDLAKSSNNQIDIKLDENRKKMENFTKKFEFPLNTVKDVYNFSKEIEANEEYRTYLLNTFNAIGGTDGKEEGKIIAKKLLGIIFSKHVLTLFSWTGISRTKGLEKKEAFQSCEGIIALFYDVISMADSRWTQQKNETFFKLHTLKHAKQTNQAYEKRKMRKLETAEDIPKTVIASEDGVAFSESVLPETVVDPETVDGPKNNVVVLENIVIAEGSDGFILHEDK